MKTEYMIMAARGWIKGKSLQTQFGVFESAEECNEFIQGNLDQFQGLIELEPYELKGEK